MDGNLPFGIQYGEKFDIALENGRVYRTVLEDGEGFNLSFSVPFFKGIPVIFHRGQEVALSYFRDNGRFMISGRVDGFKNDGNVRLVTFKIYGQPVKRQMRNAFRLPCSLQGVARPMYAGPFPMRSSPETDEDEFYISVFDIGEGGVGFYHNARLDTADKYYIKVTLDWPEKGSPTVSSFGEIVRCVRTDEDEKKYLCGFKFLKLDEETRKDISRFVLFKQQQILAQKRLVEDE